MQAQIHTLFDQARAYLIDQYHSRQFSIEIKNRNDWVTEADLHVQSIFEQGLHNIRPDVPLVSEEKPSTHNQDPDSSFWILDPLDGTLNFGHGLPIFGISLALVEGGNVTHAWIDLPMLGQHYFAAQGKGAFCNQEPIRVSDCQDLKTSMIAIGQPHTFNDGIAQLTQIVSKEHQSFRRSGSAVFNFTQIARGALDVFYACKLGPWDLAAGILLVTEAGGRVENIDGTPHSDLWNGHLIASNARLSLKHLHQA